MIFFHRSACLRKPKKKIQKGYKTLASIPTTACTWILANKQNPKNLWNPSPDPHHYPKPFTVDVVIAVEVEEDAPRSADRRAHRRWPLPSIKGPPQPDLAVVRWWRRKSRGVRSPQQSPPLLRPTWPLQSHNWLETVSRSDVLHTQTEYTVI